MVMPKKRKWFTIVDYFCEETAEVLKKYQIDNGEYIKIKTLITYENYKNYGTKKLAIRCKKNPQTKLEFE